MKVTQIGPWAVPGGIWKYIERAYEDGTTFLLDRRRWRVKSIKPYPDTEPNKIASLREETGFW